MYPKKAREAIDKNFDLLLGFKTKELKAKDLQLFHNLELTQLRKQISTSKEEHLTTDFISKFFEPKNKESNAS